MATAEPLQSRLDRIEEGARWFRALTLVLHVLGVVALAGGGLQLLGHLRDPQALEVLSEIAGTLFSALPYFLLALLARRAADGFRTIGDLIREVGEIV